VDARPALATTCEASLSAGEQPAGAGVDARWLARLRWRCRRGMLENDLILERFLDARAGALRRLATEREFQAIVSSRNKAAMVAFAFGGSRNANLAARWFGRALLRKSRGGTAQTQKGSSPSW